MRISDWSSDVCSSDLGYKAPGSLPDKAEKKPAEPAFFRCFRASSRIGRTGLEPVYEQVQTQPDHVNEVPVPGGAFEAEVMIGGEVNPDQAAQNDGKENGAQYDGETVEAGQHLAQRTGDTRKIGRESYRERGGQ